MSWEDRLAILEQIARYSYAWDGLDADGYAGLFLEDGVFEVDPQAPGGPVTHLEGRAAIREWASQRFTSRRHRTRHNQSSTLFDELTSERARTRTMNLTIHIDKGEPGDPTHRIWSTGVYHDELYKTAEGWRFAKRSLQHDIPGA